MRYIELRGKYAVEPHRYACVDDDMFDELNQHKWKAKPNGCGANVYAIRTTMCSDGKMRDVRMHRVVVNYNGPLDIDHINHDSLDNRRSNLRVVTRRENQLNRKTKELSGVCVECSTPFTRLSKSGRLGLHCSSACYQRATREVKAPTTKCCSKCNAEFTPKTTRGMYCSARCKQQVKWARMVANNSPTVQRNAERSKAWRQRQKIAGPHREKIIGGYSRLDI